MSTHKQTHWALLPDDVLRSLGESDSLNGASRRIQSEMRQWGLDSADGFVISHESVLLRESADGIVWTELLTPWLKSVAFGQEPQASTADRLSAALALLSTHFLGFGADKILGMEAQQVVSAILMEHPVLLHPRLIAPVFRHGRGVVDLLPVAGVLLATKGGTYPSASHVSDGTRLQKFALSALAAAPFNRLVPKKAWEASSSLGRKKHALTGGKPMAAAKTYGTPAPQFVASLLETSRLRGGDAAILAPGGKGDAELLKMVGEALPSALGLHRYNLGTAGIESAGPCEEFIREVRDGGFATLSSVQNGLAEGLLQRIVMKPSSFQTQVVTASPDLVRENCEAVLRGLARLGLSATELDAAAWLTERSLRGGRNGLSVPETTVEAAIAVFSALGAAGLAPKQMEPVNLLKDESRDFATWRNAHDIYSRQAAMESVLANAKGDEATEAPSPRRRRPGL